MRRLALASLLLVAACEGSSPASGAAAFFRLQGAQFVEGEIGTEEGAAKPEVHSISSQNNRLYRGVQNKSLGGTVGPESTALRIGMRGDAGHWLLPVDVPDQNTPGDFVFAARASFSPDLGPGAALRPCSDVAPALASSPSIYCATIVYRAVSRDAQAGPVREQVVTLDLASGSEPLRILLEWDTQADLDLHVLAPASNGGSPISLGSKKRTTLNPPANGEPAPTQQQIEAAGHFELDSNSQCVIDGRRQELAVWPADVPSGHYEIRIDAFSLCGEAAARWKLTISSGGRVLDQALGQMGEADTRFGHGDLAGLLVSQFDL